MQRRQTVCQCIRCREVRNQSIDSRGLIFDDLIYHTSTTDEHFLSFVTPDDHLAGFLRLSLPHGDSPLTGMQDLSQAAIIREVHVYGQSIMVGKAQQGAAQHVGLGTRLIQEAEKVAADRGFNRLAVIAAVGTRPYYLRRGFYRGESYLLRDI
jgi:elongator complex protein 3